LSLLVHFIIGIIAALIYVGGAQAGGGTEGNQAGGVGVAVMTETELGQMQNAGLDAETPAVPEIAQAALPGAETDLSVQDATAAGGDQGGLEQGLGGLTSGMGAG